MSSTLWGNRTIYEAGSRLLQSMTSYSWIFTNTRSIVSVDVPRNQVDRALKNLKKKILDEGLRDVWLSQNVFTKPSQVRKLARVETEKRLKKREFKEKLRWIMRRKARGF